MNEISYGITYVTRFCYSEECSSIVDEIRQEL